MVLDTALCGIRPTGTFGSADGRKGNVMATTEITLEPGVVRRPHWNPAGVRAAVDRLGPEIDRRADEAASLRRIPDDLYERIVEAGLLRQLVAAEQGGVGATPLDWFRNGLALGRHDPSVAWVVTQGAAELGWIASGADPAWAAEVLADPRAASASTIAGQGRLVVEGDHGTLSGRWGFDTGCHGATWIGGMALLEGDGIAPDDARFCWVPAERATVLDDWDPIGMKGTGSDSIRIDPQEIPLTWTLFPLAPNPNERGPYTVLVGNGNWPISAAVAAVQLGAARRALDETREILLTKVGGAQLLPLATNPGIQVELMQAEGRWAAAEASMERELAGMWEQASDRGALDVEQRLRLKLATVNANSAAVHAAHVCTELTRTTTVDPTKRLTGCIADIWAMQGHVSVMRRQIELAGEAYFGLTDEPSLEV